MEVKFSVSGQYSEYFVHIHGNETIQKVRLKFLASKTEREWSYKYNLGPDKHIPSKA